MSHHCYGFKNIALDIADYFADHGLDGWNPVTTWATIRHYQATMREHIKGCPECNEVEEDDED
jgi:hypothetical protein